MFEVLQHLKNVSQVYGIGDRQFTAISDVELDIGEGEFVSLLGPSGCGKSTLLRIITGLQPPTSGEVIYRGEQLKGVNPRSSIIFQSFALYPWLTVQENVEVALKARGVTPKQRGRRALDMLHRVGLEGFETAYPRELSGGMRQKVGFARALSIEPELLCLDEPFSALDPLSAEALRGELLELWTTGAIPTKSLLMVSHNIEEAVFMSDRIVLMDKEPGRVVAELTVSLPHPRDRKSREFLEIVDKVFAILAGQTLPEADEHGSAPGAPGRTRPLPHIELSDLFGLVEHIDLSPGNTADIYRLADEFQMEVDDVLPLVEAAEILGMGVVSKGDIALTTLGETFAEASIGARKEIFASRIRRLPFFQWLLTLLKKSDKHQLKWDVVQMALELEFPPHEAEKQLETAVTWGRYATVLAYEDDTGILSLEPESSTDKAA
ncbi:MAG: AAA-associated domain-containing protein [Desulfovibrio sp.]|jgi:NitT/TauT family transport system ATP-binding protein|nr:AAA-associated domain-containing protein [Desulfovibrio sp.]MBI4960749.1 AAA-associated domain-containing protein [Desulfovibrio sp.]